MRVECIKAGEAALGRALKAGEADDIEARIKKAMRALRDADPEAFMAKSRADRFQEAGELAAQEIVAEAQRKKELVALQAAAVQRVSHVIAEGKAAGFNGFESLDRQVAFHADGKSNTQSVETQAKAIYKNAVRQMIATLEASNPKWFGLLSNRDGEEAVLRALFGEDTGNADAKKGAEEFHKVTESLRQRMNRAGGNIGKLANWAIPQHHSQLKVWKAGVDAWVSKMLDYVDRKAYVTDSGEPMTNEDLTNFLREAWKSIATGGVNKLEPGKFKGNGVRANRGSEERQIHFKDATSYLAYQREFGERSLYEVMMRHIEGLARDIAMVETFGPNPDAAHRLFRDQALKDMVDAGTYEKTARKQAVRSESLYNQVAGKTLPVASEFWAKTFDTLRSWLVASRLGSAVISSFSDDATLHLTAHIMDLPEMQLIRNELAAFNPANRVEERMANRAGLALDTMIATMNRFGQDGLGTTFASKLSSTVLRASGLFAMTEARRRAFGVTAMHAIGSVVRDHDTLAALDAADKRLLKNRGITESDFNVWKAAEQEDWGKGNDTMLTPDSIYRISDEAIDQAIGPRIQKLKDETKAATDELAARDIEDRGWVAKRAQNISSWLAKERAKVEARIGKADAAGQAKLKDIQAKIGRLEENVDALAESWRTPETRANHGPKEMLNEFGEDMPLDRPADYPGISGREKVSFYGKGKLRAKGVDEGRAREAAKNLQSQIGAIQRALTATKIDALDQLFERFNEKRAELDEFTKQSEERIGKRQKVVDRLERDLNPSIERARIDAREKAATRLLGIILEETDVAIVEPGAVERAVAGANLQRGTLKGELTKSFFLFKSFPMAMLTRHFKRGMSMPSKGGRAAYLATLLVSTTIMGALSLEVSEILKGRDPRKLFGEGSFKNWLAAMLKGGSLGIYGDFLFSEQSQHGGSALASLAGPVAGELEDIIGLTQGNLVQASQGKDTNIGAEAVRFLKGNLPGASLWYSKAALDHMIFDRLQEYFSPGYLRKMRHRAQTEFNQEFWWEPGEMTPQRAPDIGATVGE